MNYQETLEFLFSQLPAYHRIGKAAYKNNLDNTLRLDDHLGHPHKNFKTIHIAGTNGKGSVSHMAASILQEAGLKTGLYTSPHLTDFRERIRINGTMIHEEEVIAFVERNRNVIEEIKPSFFEMTVALAYYYFSRMNTDIAVIETGLGGRLDSTNIITPLVSVITNIGHDHMDLLGDTLTKVAAEKAGIIKEGVPAVIGETSLETSDVFISRADTMHSVISFADIEFSCSLEDSFDKEGLRNFRITDKAGGSIIEGQIPLGGDYQARNLVTLFGLFKSLKGTIDIDTSTIIKGIRGVVENTGLQGRWQVISHQPLVICDTGHNREGLEYVLKQLKKIKAPKIHIVLGFVNDKDLGSVLPLFPVGAEYYFTRASVNRALDEDLLKSKASEYGLKGRSFDDVKKAANEAIMTAGKDDVVFIGGSTFVVGDFLQASAEAGRK